MLRFHHAGIRMRIRLITTWLGLFEQPILGVIDRHAMGEVGRQQGRQPHLIDVLLPRNERRMTAYQFAEKAQAIPFAVKDMHRRNAE
jgi:hypothetical protein